MQMEWSGSSHTMGEAIARMKQREEATIKRERAMAYAFSHQVNKFESHIHIHDPRHLDCAMSAN